MIDAQEFMLGCKRVGGVAKKHSEWDYSCDINGLSIGMNINGLLQVFDRRGKTSNDVSMLNLDRFYLDENKKEMVFHSATGKLEINPISRGIKVQTTITPHEVDSDRFTVEKEASRYGQAKIKVPSHSVLKMSPPKVGSIEWETEELEPILYSDGRNIVKGTKDDFLSSTHAPEYEHTTQRVPVSFRIGEDISYLKKTKESYTDDDAPPLCIPVGKSCYSREHLYAIAEEIIDKPIIDPYGGIVKEAMGKTVRLEGFKSRHPDFEDALRITGKNGVYYVVYRVSFLPENKNYDIKSINEY